MSRHTELYSLNVNNCQLSPPGPVVNIRSHQLKTTLTLTPSTCKLTHKQLLVISASYFNLQQFEVFTVICNGVHFQFARDLGGIFELPWGDNYSQNLLQS